mgnify:CR=1 FL=1
MTEAIKNGKDPFADEKSGKNCKTRKNGDAGDSATTAPSVGGAASSPSTGDSSSASTPKLTGKAFHDASKRVSAIERKLAKLEEHPEKFTMLTGDRPTGRLHLGHYFGSIRERVAMQNRGVNSNIIIADYQ